MTAYFRKSFKVAPGVHINLSKRGTGVSFGGRGAHVSFSPTGRVTKTLNIPGTGIYYRDVDTLHAKAAHAPQSEPTTPTPHSPEPIAMRAPTTALPTAHQVVAVEHHGFYISHAAAAFFSLLAAAIIAITNISQPLNPWEPILIVIGAITLILWLRDLTHSAKERSSHHE